jgi:hypothetical protein
MENNTTPTEQTGTRPTFLTVLCILSFIAAGISIIVLLIGIAGKGAAETAGISTDNIANMEGMDPALQASLEKAKAAFSWPNIIGSILLSIIGLVGVILMWKLQKKGFFIYTGAGILGLILPLILGAGFSVFGAIITFAFIAMYALNLKHMK